MGQRSQIYIRYNVEYNGTRYRGLIARYFQWNYGERMVSRARYIIEYIKDAYLTFPYSFASATEIKKLERYCDINFDMKDVVISTNIIDEVKYGDSDISTIFDDHNNDGQLYIDVTNDRIKYCFTEYCHGGKPMNGEEYMKWDTETDDHINWHIPYQFMKREVINYTEDNIAEIDSMAELMTRAELEDFVNDDYSYLVAPEF